MQALVVNQPSPGDLRLASGYPDPVALSGEVLVRVDLAGICSTDLEIARGYMGFRGVPGHEFVGTVLEGDARLVGRRVVAEINCPPPGFNGDDLDARKHAAARTVLGILGRDGAFAERLSIPAANCLIVPDEIDNDHAVFTEPLAAALQVLRDVSVSRRDHVAVLGAGRLGLLCAQVLAHECDGLHVLVRRESRAALCRRLGLRPLDAAGVTPDRMWDTIVECSGSPAGLQFALAHVRPRGTIVLKSTYAPPQTAGGPRGQASDEPQAGAYERQAQARGGRNDPRTPHEPNRAGSQTDGPRAQRNEPQAQASGPLDLAPIVINEIRVVGSRCGPFDTALEWLRLGRMQLAPLISARFTLSDGVAAFDAARHPDNVKVLIEPSPAA